MGSQTPKQVLSICNEVAKLTKKSIIQPIRSKSSLQEIRETQNNLSISYSEPPEIAAHCSLKLKTFFFFLICGVKKK